jgi:hypothetical protein
MLFENIGAALLKEYSATVVTKTLPMGKEVNARRDGKRFKAWEGSYESVEITLNATSLRLLQHNL